MKKRLSVTMLALMAMLLSAGMANAASVSFNFKIPAIPWPPEIKDVTNASPSVGDTTFLVVATIAAQLQQKPTCDKPNQGDCTASDWYLKPDSNIVPNPPDIKMAKVYYYLNDGAAASVDMVKAPELGENKWKADVPVDAAAKKDDVITYYIVAVDSRGNAASQVPNTGAASATCPPSPSSWFDTLSTPTTNSCTHATSYTQCNVHANGSPSCGTAYTMNDKTGDVCGEPNGNGDQSVISLPKQDILGMTAAADKDYLCVSYGLGAAPPDSNDVSPIEGYLIIIFNPDKYDDNPADFQIKNAYAITYAPEVQATDPTLVRVLWDANCVTDPNTSNILDCKLIYVTGTDKKLQVGYNSSLRFIVKKSGTGNPLPVSFSLIGDTRKLNYLVAVTGEINLSGSNPFWISDLTPGMSFYHKNQTTTVKDVSEPMVPILKATKCSISGSGGTSSTCSKTTQTAPAQDKCTVSFLKSLTSNVESYKIYKGSSSDYSGATLLTTVPSTGAADYSYNDSIATAGLDGSTFYYFVSSVKAGLESKSSDISGNVTTCTVEDWKAPDTPTISKAATPTGNEKKCKLEWTIPQADSSLTGFVFSRDGVPLNPTNPQGAEAGVTSFSYTDPTTLNLNTPYNYTVQSIDRGDNTKSSTQVACTPEDLKAPGQISSAVASNLSGKLGVHLDWSASTEEDLGGYKVYWCRLTNSAIDCRDSGSFAALSGSALLSKTDIAYESFDTGVFTAEGDYCFYVEAADNCDTASTCPSRGAGNPNGSGFPSGGADSSMYVKCLQITVVPDPVKPAFPSGVAATAPSEGKKCKLTWNKNFKNSDGSAFEGTPPVVNPLPKDLTGYKVMRGVAGAVPTPAQANAVGTMGYSTLEFTDTTVANGQTYAYVVYSVDGSSNFSENGSGGNSTEVSCTPADTVAPDVPTLVTPMDYTEIACSPSWGAVSGAASYKVYKCNGAKGSTSCNASNKFTVDADCTPGAATTCTNNVSLTTDSTYTFCATAIDESNNESAVYSNGSANCGECTPSARPKPVTGVTASRTSDGFGAKVYWTNSESLAGNNTSASGVNVYRCTDAACATKTVVKSCTQLAANSSTVQNISFSSPLTLLSEPVGTWYYGVTFQTDCTSTTSESYVTGGTAISGSVLIDAPPAAQCPTPTTCVKITACNDADLLDATKNLDCGLREVTVTAYSVTMDESNKPIPLYKDPARAAYKSGVSIYLVKESDGSVIGEPATTDSKGNYEFQIDNTGNAMVDTSKKYLLVMRIPAADKAGLACTKSSDLGSTVSGAFGSDCGIIFAKGLTLTNGTPLKAKFAVPIPAKGQGRSEIGNFDCDNAVGLKDFTIFKTNFKIGQVSSGAAKYSDINQDGYVNLTDFTLFKQNMGKVLDAAPAFVADLCKP